MRIKFTLNERSEKTQKYYTSGGSNMKIIPLCIIEQELSESELYIDQNYGTTCCEFEQTFISPKSERFA